MTARGEPGEYNMVAWADIHDSLSNFGYNPGRFMAEHQCVVNWPLSVYDVKVGMAHAAGADFHGDLTGAWSSD